MFYRKAAITRIKCSCPCTVYFPSNIRQSCCLLRANVPSTFCESINQIRKVERCTAIPCTIRCTDNFEEFIVFRSRYRRAITNQPTFRGRRTCEELDDTCLYPPIFLTRNLHVPSVIIIVFSLFIFYKNSMNRYSANT